MLTTRNITNMERVVVLQKKVHQMRTLLVAVDDLIVHQPLQENP